MEDQANNLDEEACLDGVFHALSHRTRRALLTRLSGEPQRVTDLAGPFDVSLNAISKHLKVLEHAGLVSRKVDGRVHLCSLRGEALRDAKDWFTFYRDFWEAQLDGLERYAAGDETGHDDGEPA